MGKRDETQAITRQNMTKLCIRRERKRASRHNGTRRQNEENDIPDTLKIARKKCMNDTVNTFPSKLGHLLIGYISL